MRRWQWMHAVPIMVLMTWGFSCSGPANQVLTVSADAAEPLPELGPVEDFDARPYREAPPPTRPVLYHDAPEALLLGRAGSDRMQAQQGFRIQILSSRKKEEADRMAAQAIQWWEEERERGNLRQVLPRYDGAPPVYQDFIEPYWRVRLGDFTARATAQTVLPAVRDRFGSAFIAPSEITVQ